MSVLLLILQAALCCKPLLNPLLLAVLQIRKPLTSLTAEAAGKVGNQHSWPSTAGLAQLA
jgi:hypothetical protein